MVSFDTRPPYYNGICGTNEICIQPSLIVPCVNCVLLFGVYLFPTFVNSLQSCRWELETIQQRDMQSSPVRERRNHDSTTPISPARTSSKKEDKKHFNSFHSSSWKLLLQRFLLRLRSNSIQKLTLKEKRKNKKEKSKKS